MKAVYISPMFEKINLNISDVVLASSVENFSSYIDYGDDWDEPIFDDDGDIIWQLSTVNRRCVTIDNFYDRWFCTKGDTGIIQVRYDDISAFICNEENKQLQIFIRGLDQPRVYGFNTAEALNTAFEELKSHL